MAASSGWLSAMIPQSMIPLNDGRRVTMKISAWMHNGDEIDDDESILDY